MEDLYLKTVRYMMPMPLTFNPQKNFDQQFFWQEKVLLGDRSKLKMSQIVEKVQKGEGEGVSAKIKIVYISNVN